MAPVDHYAAGKAVVAALAEEFSQPGSMNEATTRLRVIDRLLQALAWPPAEMRAEISHGGTYTDYELGAPHTEVIVEAKKEGVPFTLPAGVAGRQSVDLPTLLEDAPTAAAIRQVLGYCQERGVPIGVICNGHQVVAFYASRQDGVPPLEGRTLCFSSLAEMRDNFQTLWNHLSRDGVAERNLARALLGKTFKSLPPAKLADLIHDYPGFRHRERQETDLKILGGVFIQDLEYEESISDDFVRSCYISSGALSQYAMVSKEILRARYNPVERAAEVSAEAVRLKKGVNPKLTDDMVTAAMSRRPLILLGDVGVGKSMFLRHLLRVDAVDVLQDTLVFYLDFGRRPALATDLEQHVAEEMTEQLKEKQGRDIYENKLVRAVYHAELNALAKGIYKDLKTEDPSGYRQKELELLASLISDRSRHLERSLEHLRATEKRAASIVVVLDNIDQRPSEFQDRVFLIAQTMAASWRATVFVALRPSTFFDSKSSGSLAAYQPRVFTVSPTRVDEVISRRLDFAKESLLAASSTGAFQQNLSLTSQELLTYLDVLREAFIADDDLKSLIDNMSGGNLRLAMEFLASFVGSAYVSTKRILDVAAEGGKYKVPMHEFLRAIIYTEYDHYDPRVSQVLNLFWISSNDGREHFLLPTLLAHVQHEGEAGGADGFVLADELFSVAQGLGFLQEQVGPHLARALSKRLLETPQGHGAGGPFRITTAGSYMCNAMIEKFVYVDAMIVDTPIVEHQVRQRIRDVRSIDERLARAKTFRTYLDEQWQQFAQDAALPFAWPDSSAALEADIRTAEGHVQRARTGRR